MVTQEKPILLKTIVIVFGILLVEAGAFLYYFPPSISGYSIADLTKIYSNINPTSKMFLMIQWVVIVLILLIIFLKNKGIWRRKSEKEGINIDVVMKKSKTNLDALYLILQDKKQLSVRTICDLFEIKEELAMEWARILEAGELVTIEYPGMGSPVVVLKEEKKEQKSVEKSAKSKEAPAKGKEKPKDQQKQQAKPITKQRHAKKKVNELIKNLKSQEKIKEPKKNKEMSHEQKK